MKLPRSTTFEYHLRVRETALAALVLAADASELRSVACQADGIGATLSHMEIGVRDLRNRTAQVIDAVKAGERVTLSVHGEPVADIVPHGQRARWLSGPQLRSQLAERAADPALSRELDELAGQTLDEL
jgi:prevent-host-death family protein